MIPIERFATSLRDFEGKPGDPNYINNNPGNCRCSPVGYLPKYGHVYCTASNFAHFPTYELGWEYLQNLIVHRIELHPTWTFYDFFANYAPSKDNNSPKHYAEVVAADCGVSPHTTVLAFLNPACAPAAMSG